MERQLLVRAGGDAREARALERGARAHVIPIRLLGTRARQAVRAFDARGEEPEHEMSHLSMMHGEEGAHGLQPLLEQL